MSTRPEYTTRADFLVNHLAFTKDLQITNNHSCETISKEQKFPLQLHLSPHRAPVSARAAQARPVHPRNTPAVRALTGARADFRARWLVSAHRFPTAGLVAAHVKRRAAGLATRCVVGTVRLQRTEPTRDSQHSCKGTQNHTRTSLAYLVAQCPWCWVPLHPWCQL